MVMMVLVIGDNGGRVMMKMKTLMEKKRLSGRVARTRRPDASVIKRAQRPGPPSRAAGNHLYLFLYLYLYLYFHNYFE